jgi:hypothetical protein
LPPLPSGISLKGSRLATLLIIAIVALSMALAGGASVASPGVRQFAVGGADGHGYPRTYHLYGYGPLEELTRYDIVVGFSWFNIAGLRSLNPNGIFLLNPAMIGDDGRLAVHVTSPGGASSWPGGTDDQAGGVNLGSIRAVDPAWDLLHNADGSYATMGGSSWIKGWNLADPKAKGTPELVSKVFAYAAKKDALYSAGWDGVHSDNWIYTQVGSSWFYGPNLDTDRDGTVDETTTLRRNWANGLTRVGTNLRAYLPGKIVGGNGAWYRSQDYTGSDPEGWLKASNYTLVEHTQDFAYKTPDSFLALTRQWLDYPDPLGKTRYMAVLEDALDASGSPDGAGVRERAPDFLLWASGIFDDELRRAERRVEAAALRGR